MENPWNIQSIYELQYFNCPSCAFKNHFKQEFINHAYENHTDSIDHLLNINDNSLSDIIFPNNEVEKPNIEKSFEDPLNPNESTIEIKSENFNVEKDSSINQLKQFTSSALNSEKYNIKFEDDKIIIDSKDVKEELLSDPLEVKNEKIDNEQTEKEENCEDLYKYSSENQKIPKVHTELNKCELCNKEFNSQHCLKIHFISVHQGEKIYGGVCPPDQSQTPRPKKPRDTHNLSYKIQIIDEIKIFGVPFVSKKYALNESMIRKWRKNEAQIRETLG